MFADDIVFCKCDGNVELQIFRVFMVGHREEVVLCHINSIDMALLFRLIMVAKTRVVAE